ncbi:retrovirus-related pol polyprotein from transposon TNT 1-94 [Tanacetum coccineum]
MKVTKTALGYQNPLYLTQAQRKVPTLYCGNTIVKQHVALSVIDTEKTFELDEESILKMQTKQNDPILQEKKLLLSQDLVHTAVNSLTEIIDYQTMEKNFLDEYSECVELKVELSKKNEIVKKAVYNDFQNDLTDWKTDVFLLKSKCNKTKKVFRITNLKTLSNANVKHSVLNTNSELICATCNECMFDAIHDLCVLDYVNDINVRIKSKSVKRKKKKDWKPTGKVFTNVGYSWKLTGRMFTINGSTCPLTRINSTIVVPPREPTSTKVVKKSQPSSNNSGKLKDITDIEKSKKYTHKPKFDDSIQEKLYLLHMDLCDPMRIESISGKKYILILQAYYDDVGITHQTSVERTLQQNDVVERQNRTLVEAARMMLIFSKAPLFLWAETVTTACYT